MTARQHPRRDDGFTLVEVIIAMTLGIVLIGVMVSVLITSMNAADSTNAQAHDSTDLSTVSAFLYRDAQATNVSVSATGFQTCTASGTPVGSFQWNDRLANGTTNTYIAAYSLSPKTGSTAFTLTRTLCTNGTAAAGVTVLGQSLFSANLACVSPTDCSTLPSMVTLHIIGGSARNQLDTTLSAAVRSTTASWSDQTAQDVSLLLLGDGVACPIIDMQGTNNDVSVDGSAIISTPCPPASAVNDPLNQLTPLPVQTSGLADPLAGSVNPPPDTDCPAGAKDPGSPNTHPRNDPTLAYYYPGFTTLTGANYFPPGRYFFCNGLKVAAGATIEGSDVFIAVRNNSHSGKGLVIDPTATVNLTAQTSGSYKGLLIWLSSSTSSLPFQLGLNGAVSNYGGLVYVPNSVVTLQANSSGVNESIAGNIGGVIARQLIFNGSGTVRLGPTPTDISLSPTALPAGIAGQAYSTTVTAPGINETRWQQLNLPNGLDIDDSGTISGTPTCSGAFSPELAAFEPTSSTQVIGRAAGAAYDGHTSIFNGDGTDGVTYSKLVIDPSIALAKPASPTKAPVSLKATASNCATSSTKVTFQAASTTTPNTWATICNNKSADAPNGTAFSCTWSPSNGTYNLRAQATDSGGLQSAWSTVGSITVDSSGPAIGNITPASGVTMSGSQAVSAVVTDAGSGIAGVTFALSGSGSPTCAGTVISTNTYGCNLAVGALTAGSYTLTVTATDNLGNVSSTSQTNPVNNAPTGVDVQIINGTGTVGKVDPGDQVTLTYSVAMSMPSIRTGWTTGSASIDIRVADSNNKESVGFYVSNNTSTPVNLGSVNIGNGYIARNTTVWFHATMVMSADGKTITITLGTFDSGNAGNLSTNGSTTTLVWTPSALAKSTNNVAVSTTPVNESGSPADKDF